MGAPDPVEPFLAPARLALLEHLPEIIVVADDQARMRWANATTLDLMGYRLDEIVGQSIFDFVHPDDLAYMLSSWEKRLDHQGAAGGGEAEGGAGPVPIDAAEHDAAVFAQRDREERVSAAGVALVAEPGADEQRANPRGTHRDVFDWGGRRTRRGAGIDHPSLEVGQCAHRALGALHFRALDLAALAYAGGASAAEGAVP